MVTDIHTGPVCFSPMDSDAVIGSRLGPIVTIGLVSNADFSDLDGQIWSKDDTIHNGLGPLL